MLAYSRRFDLVRRNAVLLEAVQRVQADLEYLVQTAVAKGASNLPMLRERARVRHSICGHGTYVAAEGGRGGLCQ